MAHRGVPSKEVKKAGAVGSLGTPESRAKLGAGPRATVQEYSSPMFQSPSRSLVRKFNPFNKRSSPKFPTPTVIDERESIVSERSFLSEMGKMQERIGSEKLMKNEEHLFEGGPALSSAEVMERAAHRRPGPKSPREKFGVDDAINKLKVDYEVAKANNKLKEFEMGMRLTEISILFHRVMQAATASSESHKHEGAESRRRAKEFEDQFRCTKTEMVRLQTELSKKQEINTELTNSIERMKRETQKEVELAVRKYKASVYKSMQKLAHVDFSTQWNLKMIEMKQVFGDMECRGDRMESRIGLLREKLQKLAAKAKGSSGSSSKKSPSRLENRIGEIKKQLEGKEREVEQLRLKHDDELFELRKEVQLREDLLEERNREFESIRSSHVHRSVLDEREAEHQQEVVGAKSALEEALRENKDLGGKLDSLQGVQDQAITLQSRLEMTEAELAEARNRVEELRQSLRNAEEAGERVQELQRKCEDFEEEMRSYSRVNEDLIMQVKSHEDHVEYLEASLVTSCKSKEIVEEEIYLIKKDMSENFVLREDAEAERRTFAEKVNSLSADILEKDSLIAEERRKHEAELRKLEEDNNRSQTQLEALTHAASQSVTVEPFIEVQKDSEQAVELRNKIEDQRMEFEREKMEIEGRYQAQVETQKDCTKELEAERQVNVDLKKKLTVLKEEADNAARLNAKLGELTQEIAQLKLENAKLQSMLKQEENAVLQTALAERNAQVQVQELQADVVTLRQTLEEREAETQKIMEQHRKSREQLSEEVVELGGRPADKSNREELQRLSEENARLIQEVAAANEECKRNMEAMNVLQQKLDENASSSSAVTGQKNKEIEVLRAQLQDMERDIGTCHAQLEAKDREKQEMRVEMSEICDANSGLTMEINEASKKYSQLEAEGSQKAAGLEQTIRQLTASTADLEVQLHVEEKAAEELRARITGLEAQNKGLNSENARRKQEYEGLELKFIAVNNQLAEITRMHSEATREVEEHEQQKAKSIEQIEEFKKLVSVDSENKRKAELSLLTAAHERELNERDTRIKELNAVVKQTEDRYQGEVARLQLSCGELEKLRAELKSLKSKEQELGRLQGKCTELSQELDLIKRMDYEAQLKTKGREIAELFQQLETAREKCQSLESSISSVKQESDLNSKKQAEENVELTRRVTELETERETLLRRIEKLGKIEQDALETQRELDSLKAATDEKMRSAVEAHQRVISAKSKELEAGNIELFKWRQKAEALEGSSLESSTALSDLRIQLDQSKNQFESQIRQLEHEHEQKVLELSSKIQKLEKEREEWQRLVEEANEGREAMMSQRDRAREDAEDSIQQLSDEIQDLNEKLFEATVSCKAQLDKREEEHEQDLSTREARLKKCQDELNEALRKLETLEEHAKTYESKADSLRTERDRLTLELNEIREDVARTQPIGKATPRAVELQIGLEEAIARETAAADERNRELVLLKAKLEAAEQSAKQLEDERDIAQNNVLETQKLIIELEALNKTILEDSQQDRIAFLQEKRVLEDQIAGYRLQAEEEVKMLSRQTEVLSAMSTHTDLSPISIAQVAGPQMLGLHEELKTERELRQKAEVTSREEKGTLQAEHAMAVSRLTSEKNGEIDELQQRCKGLENKLVNIEQDYRTAKDEIVHLNEQIEDMSNEHEASDLMARTGHEAECEAFRAKLSGMEEGEKQLQVLQDSLKENVRELEKQQLRDKELLGELESCRKEVEELRKQLEECRNARAKLQTESQNVKAASERDAHIMEERLQKQEVQMEELVESFTKTAEAHQQSISQLQDEIDMHKEEHNKLLISLNDSARQHEDDREEVVRLEEDLKQLRVEFQLVNSEYLSLRQAGGDSGPASVSPKLLEDLRRENKELEEKYRQLEVIKKEYDEEKEVLASNFIEANNMIRALEEAKNNEIEVRRRVIEKLEEKDKEIAALRKCIELTPAIEMEEPVVEHAARKTEASEELGQLNAQLQEITASRSLLESELKSTQQELMNLQKDHESALTKLSDQQVIHEEALRDLSSKHALVVEQWEKRKKEMEKDIENLSNANEVLDEEVKNLKFTKVGTERENDSLNRRLHKAQEELAGHKLEIQALKQQLDEAAAATPQQPAEEEVLSKIEDLRKEHGSKIVEYEEEIKLRTSQHEEKDKELMTAQKKISQLETERSELKSKLNLETSLTQSTVMEDPGKGRAAGKSRTAGKKAKRQKESKSEEKRQQEKELALAREDARKYKKWFFCSMLFLAIFSVILYLLRCFRC